MQYEERRQRSLKNKCMFAIVRYGVYIVSVRARRVRVCVYIDPVKANGNCKYFLGIIIEFKYITVHFY